MKSSPIYSPFTSLTLKTVGVVMIVSSILYYILIAIPFEPSKTAWQITFASQIVERGVSPMIGIGFLMAGYWIDYAGGATPREDKSFVLDLRFWAVLFSTLLGLIFLIFVPLHFYNISSQTNDAIKQINQKAGQAEAQVKKELDDQSLQIEALVKDPQKLNEQISQFDKAINSGQLKGEQLAQAQSIKNLLQASKQDPKALPKARDEQRDKLLAQIRKEKQEAENSARNNALKVSLNTGLTSLFLAIGYTLIGWLGLRGFLRG
jgi:hypothetical protein